MSSTELIKRCFHNYANFKGRASFSEYWYFVALVVSAFIIAGFFDLIVSAAAQRPIPLLTSACVVGFAVPMAAVFSRRMHDVGRSGLWTLPYSLPRTIGWIGLLVTQFTVMITGETSAFTDKSAETGIALLGVTFFYWVCLFVFSLSSSQKEANTYGPVPEDFIKEQQFNQAKQQYYTQQLAYQQQYYSQQPVAAAQPLHYPQYPPNQPQYYLPAPPYAQVPSPSYPQGQFHPHLPHPPTGFYPAAQTPYWPSPYQQPTPIMQPPPAAVSPSSQPALTDPLNEVDPSGPAT